jgi:DNA helicase IV
MRPGELEEERVALRSAREALAAMRQRTGALDSAAAGDWVSQLFLESTMYRRMRELEDDPTVPLFFGRLTYDALHAEQGGTFYIGRRHVTDGHGDPVVVDWRAPISLPFYRASGREPMGVQLRRRFGFHHGQVTAFEDEDLTSGPREAGPSRILEEEIERPRTGPMRDIVATIQPEQDVIVRADVRETICVQGAPGTG